MTPPAEVLHLRQAAGRGGGADTVLAQQLGHLVADTPVLVAYLHKPAHPVDGLVEALRRQGIAVRALPGGAWFDRAQWSALLRMVDESGVRIVHGHDSKSYALAWLLRRARPHLKVVATLHGWTRKSARDHVYERIDRWLLRGFDAVIAVADSVRREAEAGGLTGAIVIPNGIDLSAWTVPPMAARDRPFTVGYVGRLSPEKAPEDFVKIAGRLSGDLPEARFIVIGDGPERSSIEASVHALGLGDRVAVLGAVPREDLPARYAAMDVLVLPSRTEGLPMTVLEAGALMVPSVAARVGGVPEAVQDGETGLLAPSGDIDTLAALIRRLHDDPAGRRVMGEKARARVEARFSLDAGCRRLEEIYGTLG